MPVISTKTEVLTIPQTRVPYSMAAQEAYAIPDPSSSASVYTKVFSLLMHYFISTTEEYPISVLISLLA